MARRSGVAEQLQSPGREHECDGKKRFSAKTAKKLARDRSREYNEELHAYPCRFCRHWHIGHVPVTQQRGYRPPKLRRWS